jgi:hypothetical protein
MLLLVLLSGCGGQPEVDSSSKADVVRGQPISSPIPKTNASSAALMPTPEAATTVPTRPAATNATLASAAAATALVAPSGYAVVGFDKLAAYRIEIPDDLLGPVTNDLAAATAKTEALIPDSVKALSKKRVSLRGFMLPLKVEGGLVTELLIMKDQSMCCYGTVPKIHEWVSVKMVDKGVKPLMDQPVNLQGTLHVGEMRENGYLTGIYRMDGERLGAEE